MCVAPTDRALYSQQEAHNRQGPPLGPIFLFSPFPTVLKGTGKCVGNADLEEKQGIAILPPFPIDKRTSIWDKDTSAPFL